jgi:hypothetical protein
MRLSGSSDRLFSLGLWSWLAIVEKETDRLSEGAQVALKLLREDLEKLAEADGGQR